MVHDDSALVDADEESKDEAPHGKATETRNIAATSSLSTKLSKLKIKTLKSTKSKQ